MIYSAEDIAKQYERAEVCEKAAQDAATEAEIIRLQNTAAYYRSQARQMDAFNKAGDRYKWEPPRH